jgi:AmmeMemoRadiSam system protein A
MRDDHFGRQLLAVARHAIADELRLAAPLPAIDDALRRPGATFVTLFCRDELRGCIGTLKAVRAVGVDVHENALAAAFRDPRFPGLTTSEFEELSIEISLLSSPERVGVDSEDGLYSRLRPGIDGVMLEIDDRRATFLPQVWEALPDPRAFVGALKAKAGLPADFWSPRVNVSLYQVTQWKERDLVHTQASS